MLETRCYYVWLRTRGEGRAREQRPLYVSNETDDTSYICLMRRIETVHIQRAKGRTQHSRKKRTRGSAEGHTRKTGDVLRGAHGAGGASLFPATESGARYNCATRRGRYDSPWSRNLR